MILVIGRIITGSMKALVSMNIRSQHKIDIRHDLNGQNAKLNHVDYQETTC